MRIEHVIEADDAHPLTTVAGADPLARAKAATESPEMALANAPRIDMHKKMLEEMDQAIDRLTLRPEPGNLPREVKIRSILLGHDGSATSRPAFEWTQRLARILHAHVVVGSVAPPMRTYGDAVGMGVYWPGIQGEFERIEADVRKAADDAASDLRGHNVEAESVVTTGSPAAELARIARTHRADLVVLGAKGGGRVSRVLLGSVAESLTSRLDASILVARERPDLSKILVATDGSPESDRAVTLGLELSAAVKGEIVVLHVLEFEGDRAVLPPEGYLQGIVERMSLPALPRIRYVLEMGHPAERIVELAHKEGVGLTLIGARGRGRVAGALLGSVSHRVANTAHGNVLVVRGGRE